MTQNVREPRFRIFTGILPVRQWAVLFTDEIAEMVNNDPSPWIDPREVVKAREVIETIRAWPYEERLRHYEWLRNSV